MQADYAASTMESLLFESEESEHVVSPWKAYFTWKAHFREGIFPHLLGRMHCATISGYQV
jgi:hypothetical protein